MFSCDPIPQSKRANFDATHELEELLLEDKPLKAKPRKKKKEPVDNGEPETPQAKEMRIMEERFTIYDFSKINRADPQVKDTPMSETHDLYEGKEHIVHVSDKHSSDAHPAPAK
nr:hypothetical protein HK105_002930 [Polyrhizophydium stewartii]